LVTSAPADLTDYTIFG